MKKSVKNISIIILINIFLFITFYYLLNKLIDYDFYKRPQKFKSITENIDIEKYNAEPYTAKKLNNSSDIYNKYCNEERKSFGKHYNGKPITIIGCSYAYGHGLKREETFSYLLSEYTKHPVSNYSGCGYDAIDSLKNLIGNASEDNLDLPNTKYVIYVYMYDHINRYLEKYFIYKDFYNIFELTDFERFICKNNFIRKIYTYYKLHKIIKNYPDSKMAEKYLKSVLKDIEIRIKRKMPNSQFIILIYDEKIPLNQSESAIKFESDIINSSIWTEFAQETGTIIVHTKDLTGFLFDKNYKLEEDITGWHPNSKAWEVLTPAFAKKYIND